MNYEEFQGMSVELRDSTAIVKMKNITDSILSGHTVDFHWELAMLLNVLQDDDTVRVVVLTGARDGEFLTTPRLEHFKRPESLSAHIDPHKAWKIFSGGRRVHQLIAEMDKPVVAKVNGDAVGFGQSLMMACDIIVAREDARIADNHMAMGSVPPYGAPCALVPGDGGGALIPLYMAPPVAKEYLMLSVEMTARSMADQRIINHAVSADKLDELVDDIVQKLISKPAHALAWTKRIANKAVVDQLNRAMDVGLAYEMVNFLQWERAGFEQSLQF